MSGEGVRIAVTCEDQAHRALAWALSDRVLVHEATRRMADWVDERSLPSLRSYCGRGDTMSAPEHLRFYPHKNARKDVEELGRRPLIRGRRVSLHGHIGGRPLRPEAAFWRIVFMLFAAEEPPPDALIVVHDTDGDRSRLEGIEQACELLRTFEHPIPVIVATPHQDAEAWFVAGFLPESAAERQRLREIREELSFDPCEQPQRLTAHPNDARTDAKRVLRVLLHGDDHSRPPSLEELPELSARTLKDIELLERRGEGCELAAFIRGLRQVLVPLFLPPERPSR